MTVTCGDHEPGVWSGGNSEWRLFVLRDNGDNHVSTRAIEETLRLRWFAEAPICVWSSDATGPLESNQSPS
jgi:hypothetical protein